MYSVVNPRWQQPIGVAGRSQVPSANSARLSERSRHEFSGPQLSTAGHGGDIIDDGVHSLVGSEMDEDVQQHNTQIEERDEYSHLQY